MFRRCILAGAACLMFALPGVVQSQQVTSRSQTTYLRDRFGRLQAVKVAITLPTVNHYYVFTPGVRLLLG